MLRRALEFAKEQQARGRVKDPFVLGAYIHLGRCLDLTDTWATSELAWFHTRLMAGLHATGARIPRNRAAKPGDHDLLLRDLDCAVINSTIAQLDPRVLHPHLGLSSEVGGAYAHHTCTSPARGG